MIAQQLPMEFLAPAKNQKAAVLKMLIEGNGISEQETPFNGFRTRISELKREHELNIRTVKVAFKTQFGRESHYNKHFLYDSDKINAVKLFNEINK
jgi:hypothetical protein